MTTPPRPTCASSDVTHSSSAMAAVAPTQRTYRDTPACGPYVPPTSTTPSSCTSQPPHPPFTIATSWAPKMALPPLLRSFARTYHQPLCCHLVSLASAVAFRVRATSFRYARSFTPTVRTFTTMGSWAIFHDPSPTPLRTTPSSTTNRVNASTAS